MIFALLFFASVHQPASSQPQRNKLMSAENWTSCEEFLFNVTFNPEKVINIDWKIFYFWNPEIEESYTIRFSKPDQVVVDRYRVELDKELNPPVNWTDAELFMETSIDFSALYLKTSMSGRFRLIPSTAFDYPSVPEMVFGLKYVEPGYLGIANCKHRICYALAPVDKMPFHYELDKAAQKLQFYNDYNRSHTHFHYAPKMDDHLPPQDDEEDDDLDLEMDPSKMDFF